VPFGHSDLPICDRYPVPFGHSDLPICDRYPVPFGHSDLPICDRYPVPFGHSDLPIGTVDVVAWIGKSVRMRIDASAGHRRWFLAWFAVGVIVGSGLVSLLTIGIVVVAVGVAAAIWLAPRHGGRATWGVVSGLGVPVLYLAFLNRRGPGTICEVTSQSTHCADEWSPWPFVLVGTMLAVGGLTAYVGLRQRPPAARA
jgi:hypothetical protein